MAPLPLPCGVKSSTPQGKPSPIKGEGEHHSSGEKLKVLGLFGSPRRGGNTELLLEETLKGAETEGAEVDRIHLADFTITPCKECHGCDQTGNCVILDDMEKIYPKLIEADIIILASSIFFYGITAWAKALIDRSQAIWARKYLLKDPSMGKGGRKKRGFFISVGATKGQKVFEGAILTAKYFFDALDMPFSHHLTYGNIDKKGALLEHPDLCEEARKLGRDIVLNIG